MNKNDQTPRRRRRYREPNPWLAPIALVVIALLTSAGVTGFALWQARPGDTYYNNVVYLWRDACTCYVDRKTGQEVPTIQRAGPVIVNGDVYTTGGIAPSAAAPVTTPLDDAPALAPVAPLTLGAPLINNGDYFAPTYSDHRTSTPILIDARPVPVDPLPGYDTPIGPPLPVSVPGPAGSAGLFLPGMVAIGFLAYRRFVAQRHSEMGEQP